MRIALTGNIGCGKSTVSQLLLEQLPGYVLASVDDIVRALYQRADYEQALVARFGTCDRKVLSDQAFADMDFKRDLEQFASSWVAPALEEALQQPKVLVEFPLLFEMPGWAQRFDYVIALGCSDEVQRERVLARDKMSPAKFEQVQAAQLPTAVKAALADAYLDTGCTLEALPAAVAGLVPAVVQRALWVRCREFFGSDTIADAVLRAYSEPHRAYHHAEHLQELFQALEPYLPHLEHRRAVEMAVWFHDFVYSTELTSYGNNESLSAKALFGHCKQYAPQLLAAHHGEVVLACEFIVATKKHRIDSARVQSRPAALRAAQLFLDADLSILGAGVERVRRYDQDIAAEWLRQGAGIPQAAFSEGRTKALSGFLSRDRLYLSAEFAELEPIARSNLAGLIDQWSS